MNERRVQRNPRQPVSLLVGLGEGDQAPARSRNLSIGGVFLETARRPAVGEVLDLWFVWGEDTFVTKARVVHHAGDGVGFSFVEPDTGFLGALAEILAVPEKV
jgi:hypothetical protein